MSSSKRPSRSGTEELKRSQFGIHISSWPKDEPSSRILPSEFVDAIRAVAQFTFVNQYADTFFLAIRVPLDVDLLWGLAEVGAAEQGPASDPAEVTQRKSLGDEPPSFAHPPLRVTDLERWISRDATFIVPVRKRRNADRPKTNRIAIGRARNNDIVLRQAAISGFHAWLEFDETGRCHVADARSRNGTRLNRVPLTPLRPEPLHAGDHISFGDLEALVCPGDLLWQVIKKLSPPPGNRDHEP